VRLLRDVNDITDDIVSRLDAPHSRVSTTIEIEATSPDGFDTTYDAQ
jgi:hypothetical protein